VWQLSEGIGCSGVDVVVGVSTGGGWTWVVRVEGAGAVLTAMLVLLISHV